MMALLLAGMACLPMLALLTIYLMREPGRRIWAGLIWVLGVGPIIIEIFTPRSQIDVSLQADIVDPTNVQVWLSRGLLACFLYLAALALVQRLRSGRRPGESVSGLSVTALLFSAGSLIASVLGRVPNFQYGQLWLPLLLLAASLLPPVSVWFLTAHVRSVLAVYLYGSIASAVIAPGWATSAYSGVIPGISFRLHGVAPQANFLGPLAVLYLILDWEKDGKEHSAVRWLGRAAAWVVLALAQSKTAWVIVPLIYLVRPWVVDQALASLARGAKILCTAVATAGIWFMRDNLLNSDLSGGNLATLTGRAQIWLDTLHIWAENPWFGYGPSIWSLDHRLSFGGEAYLWVGQAHNQFLQTLGESGLVGMALLIPYVVRMLYAGVLYNQKTHGISLGVVTWLLLRSLTETPLREYAVNGALFVHFVVFAVLLLSERQAAAAPAGICSRQEPETVALEEWTCHHGTAS